MERDVQRAVFPRLAIMSCMSNEGERQRPPTRASPHGEAGGGPKDDSRSAQVSNALQRQRLNGSTSTRREEEEEAGGGGDAWAPPLPAAPPTAAAPPSDGR